MVHPSVGTSPLAVTTALFGELSENFRSVRFDTFLFISSNVAGSFVAEGQSDSGVFTAILRVRCNQVLENLTVACASWTDRFADFC